MPEYYRGGERSPFKVTFTSGQFDLVQARARANLIAVPSGTQERIKRVAVKLQFPKGTTGTFRGWVAFLRVASDSTIDISAKDLADPDVLRPITFVSNQDHAIYESLYMEAINMDGGESLFLLGFANSTQGYEVNYAAKWYSEASFR